MKWGVFTDKKFIGLDNFINLFGDKIFWITFKNTITYSICTVFLLFVFSLILALFLSRSVIKGEKALRATFYIPALISMIAVGIAWRFILGDEMGILNYLLNLLGHNSIPWLTNGNMAMLSLILITVWAQAGYYMVMFIAGLQAIPAELYEAAEIDGSTAIQSFRLITLPMLKSTILVVVVLATIQSFKAYELILTLTNGGPGYSTKFVVQQVYQVAFIEDRFGYASAMSIILMMVIAAFTILQFKFSGKEQDVE